MGEVEEDPEDLLARRLQERESKNNVEVDEVEVNITEDEGPKLTKQPTMTRTVSLKAKGFSNSFKIELPEVQGEGHQKALSNRLNKYSLFLINCSIFMIVALIIIFIVLTYIHLNEDEDPAICFYGNGTKVACPPPPRPED